MHGLLLRLIYGTGADCCLVEGADFDVMDVKVGGRCGMVIFLEIVGLCHDFVFGNFLH